MPANIPDASHWHLPTLATATALLLTWGGLLFRSGQRVSNVENHNALNATQIQALKDDFKELHQTLESARKDRDQQIKEINTLIANTIERIHTRIDAIGAELHTRNENLTKEIHNLALAIKTHKD